MRDAVKLPRERTRFQHGRDVGSYLGLHRLLVTVECGLLIPSCSSAVKVLWTGVIHYSNDNSICTSAAAATP